MISWLVSLTVVYKFCFTLCLQATETIPDSKDTSHDVQSHGLSRDQGTKIDVLAQLTSLAIICLLIVTAPQVERNEVDVDKLAYQPKYGAVKV